MRISDWSSDVCSSDLSERRGRQRRVRRRGREGHDEGLLRLAKKSDGRFPRERFEQEREDDEHLEREREQHDADERRQADDERSEEHTSELQSLMRISYAVFCLKKKKKRKTTQSTSDTTN